MIWFWSALARIVEWLAKSETRAFYRNVSFHFGLPRHSSFARQFFCQCLRHQVLVAKDGLLAALGFPIKISGLTPFAEHMQQSLSEGNGAIVATGHLGSWEFVGRAAALAAPGKFVALAKPSRYILATRCLEWIRKRMGIRVLWTDRSSLLRDMLAALKRGEVLGFVMDQKPDQGVGPKVQFFGLETMFVAGPGTMANKTGAPIFLVFCMREGNRAYRLTFQKIDAKTYHKDLDALTQQLASRMENVIRQYPEQWTWNYRRWSKSQLEPSPGRATFATMTSN